MACKGLNNTYNKEQEQHDSINSYITPRISFSNGFAEAKSSMIKLHSNDHCSASTAAFDFEFSVTTFDMNSADELFLNGKLLPVVEDQKNLGVYEYFSPDFDRKKVTKTTLRDELLVDDDADCYGSENEPSLRMRFPRLQKNSSTLGCKWKERFSSFKY